MDDVVVLFDGTDQEPDGRTPTNVFNFGKRFTGTVLYEPGIGTWNGAAGWAASVLGLGLYERTNDTLDRLEFYRFSRVSVIGASRGAAQALSFCWRYEQRYNALVRFCGLYDVVRAYGSGALRRGLLPRNLWRGGRVKHERPPAEVVVHAMAGREPSRLYSHDIVKDVSAERTFADLNHGGVLRDGAPGAWLEGHAKKAGLPMVG